ncbi:ubiquitin carboxyl-terminal hydrolase 47-like isoform X2 [Plectropomus leopardus]|uniref:ubiquitin carboxyl-terminal hydrolase 47-like isoform X2 n=1 Tax=Plectropomus leopardus TaxID=160734 RepID=UPI001C4BDEA3|nr:ubiquitin carboxyl-terminal hydrolase 47-like isoform X2 [Plectropomus leopardus]
MNHDLVQKFREKLDSFAISDYHGLISPGLTCYLNSVLQVLFMTEDFREAVKRCCIDDSTSIDRQLRRLFEDLQKSRAETHNFATKLGITNVYEQRDAAEYFEKILCLTSPEAAKIFKGELNHKIECLSCNDKNDSRSYFWILPLAVDDLPYQTYNVEKGLETFFKGEKVCGDNKMFCNRCNKKQDAEFGCEITQSPEVLTLLLKRFSFGYTHGRFIKLHCSADVPRTLHMKNCKYELYALVDHFGNLTGGHYTAHIRSFETYMWYHFNDDVVNKVKQPFGAGETSLRSRTAYLLMYRKVSRCPETTYGGNQETLCTHSDVEAEERQDEDERGEPLVPCHRPNYESCNRGENLRHLNGDRLKESHDDTVWKKQKNLSGELEKQPKQKERQHKDVLQTDTGVNGDRLQMLMSNFAKNETTNMTVGLKRISDKSAESKVVTYKRESVAEARTEENGIKLRKEAGVGADMFDSDVKSFHVSSNGYSPSVQHTTGYLQGQMRMNEQTGCSCSPNLYRKPNSSKRDEEKMQPAASLRQRRMAAKIGENAKREPWR